jgi:uncharacterized NAD(P)/FAD-binding protein YdhS
MVTMKATDAPVNCDIAIIGGGYSGTMLAVELLRRSDGRFSIGLIEKSPVAGLGAAYGTTCREHLLNVRAQNMSAYADLPDHFVKWAQQNQTSEVDPDDFLPRIVYGQYISTQFRKACKARPSEIRLIRGTAISLSPANGQQEIGLAGGQMLTAHKVVLALGNFPPADLPLPGKPAGSRFFLSNPWAQGALNPVEPNESVLLLGSGLTSVDVTLELRARGVQGTIHILSRRGLLPQSHAPAKTLPCQIPNPPHTARELLRMVRLRVKAAEKNGFSWRDVIDSLRSATQPIWKSLPISEQRRFIRHLRTYWDVHRHRIAEPIAEQIKEQIKSGKIQMHAGRIVQYREASAGVEISYRERGSGEVAGFRVGRVINCTGPNGDYRRVGSPLLADLLRKGLIRNDEHLLGLDVADNGAVVDSQGATSKTLYALGPLRKGKLWESIAVPELREQIAELANLLVEHRPLVKEAVVCVPE